MDEKLHKEQKYVYEHQQQQYSSRHLINRLKDILQAVVTCSLFHGNVLARTINNIFAIFFVY